MAISIGSIPISSETASWLKVRSALSDTSIRATVAKVVEREVSASREKWFNDLKVEAAKRNMSHEDLWVLIVESKGTVVLPEPTNARAEIQVLSELAEQGAFEVKKRDRNKEEGE